MNPFDLGEDIAPLISLGQDEAQVSVLAAQLRDLGSSPFGIGEAFVDDCLDPS